MILKARSPDFINTICNYDVIALNETWLVEGHESSIPVPDGYTLHVASRPNSSQGKTTMGGVAVFVRSSIPHCRCPGLSGPDILTLDFGFLFFIAAYLLPANSEWGHWSPGRVRPRDRLEEVISSCCAAAGLSKGVLCEADFNGRTKSFSSSPLFLRTSRDDGPICTQGRWLLDLCEREHLVIVNGTTCEVGNSDTDHGALTSFQPNGVSVIDYALASAGLMPRVKRFRVHDFPFDSDHALICVWIDAPPTAHAPLHNYRAKTRRPHLMSHAARASRPVNIPPPTDPLLQTPIDPSPLDLLLADAVTHTISIDEGCGDLYGPSYEGSAGFVRVWVDGSASGPDNDRRAGAGVFFGEGSPRNCAARVPGRQTNSRGELLAIAIAILTANPRKTLLITTDSQYCIRVYAYYAAAYKDSGWTLCKNADLIRYPTQRARIGRPS